MPFRLAASLAALVLLNSAAVARCPAEVAGPPLLWRAALTKNYALAATEVGITFLGHSSFEIASPGGVAIVTDYNAVVVPDRVPDIVTMNNAHTTHFTDFPDPAIKMVLRGWNPGGGQALHNVLFKDVLIRNIPTNVRDFFSGGIRLYGNSVFVYETGNLCIAHVGHLHHRLQPQDLEELGQIDVLMLPVDGAMTLGQDLMIEVMEQVKAPITLPMHYFSGLSLERFVARLRGRASVRLSDTSSIAVSRATLPTTPELVILPNLF